MEVLMWCLTPLKYIVHALKDLKAHMELSLPLVSLEIMRAN